MASDSRTHTPDDAEYLRFIAQTANARGSNDLAHEMNRVADHMATLRASHDGLVEALRAAVKNERRAIAETMCRDCARGDAPIYEAAAHHFYHDIGGGELVGCSASVVHHRVRDAALKEAEGRDE